jgi:hypothetical protein
MTIEDRSAAAALSPESATTPHNARARGKPRCGAKTRSGGECQAPTVNGKSRCRRHGGASTGATSSEGKARITKAATKHGIYAAAYSDEEIALLPAVRDRIGQLDEEIAMMRVQFRRASIAQKRAFELDDDGLEVVKRHDREKSEFGPGDETIRERVNYSQILDRLAGRIESLERTRSQLIDAAKERNDAEKSDEPITGFRITVISPNGDYMDDNGVSRNLARDGPPNDEYIAPDEPGPENPVL